MTEHTTQWYTSWFDSPYYHILYKDRDHAEAQQFMDNLTRFLDIPKGGKILDLACGKGRHSIYLNQLGYDVTGVDLSSNSIAHAKQYENDSLRFVVHDMSTPFPNQFDAVVNLFTSFGYFDKEEDNLNTIKAIRSCLNSTGFGVIDFMNSDYVIRHLVDQDSKTVNGIEFNQKRRFENGYIIKDIQFMIDHMEYQFKERVRAFTLTDFERLFDQSGVQLHSTFGDYNLRPFDLTNSERLIMIFN